MIVANVLIQAEYLGERGCDGKEVGSGDLFDSGAQLVNLSVRYWIIVKFIKNRTVEQCCQWECPAADNAGFF